MAVETLDDPAAERIRGALLAILPRLRSFSRSLAGSPEDGDDLLQATCERAISRAHQADFTRPIQGWLFRIAYHIHIDRLRAGRRRGDGHAPVDPDELLGGDAEREVEAVLMLGAVRRAIGRLPEEQRSVILMVSAGGLSYAATAEALGVPIGTVMSRLHRGRRALLRELAEPTREAAPEADPKPEPARLAAAGIA